MTHSWWGPLRVKVRSTRSAAMSSERIRFHFRRAARPCRPAQHNHQLDLIVADHQPATESEFGMDASSTVNLVGLTMDLGDQIADRVPGRRCGAKACCRTGEPGTCIDDDSPGSCRARRVRPGLAGSDLGVDDG